MSDFQVRTANIIADTGDPEGEVKCLVIDRDTFTQLIANLEEIKKRYIDLPERKIRWGSKILTFTFLRIFYYFSMLLRISPLFQQVFTHFLQFQDPRRVQGIEVVRPEDHRNSRCWRIWSR